MTIDIEHKPSILEEYDYEQKVRHLSLKSRIDWFIQNKSNMSQNEKWDAFYDICEDYDLDFNQALKMTNKKIRKLGLAHSDFIL